MAAVTINGLTKSYAAAVTINGLTKSYAAAGDAPAITGLDLVIGENKFVTLLGPSGCGKTTTLRLIAGYLVPDGGTIRVGERMLSGPGGVVPPERRGMGMVFQNYAVWPHKTVFENVVFGLKVRKVPSAKARQMVDRALALVNLTGFEDRLPSELSGGQQQRVALARSLVVEPDILLLDEPLSNLDAKLRERMRSELKALQRRTGITFIYVTHDQSEALALSDQIAVIHGGRLQQYGPPAEIYRRPANRLVADFMGHVNFIAGTVDALTAKDGHRIAMAGGLHCHARLAEPLVPGDPVEVVVRPEDVLLTADAGPEAGNAAARVVDLVYLGNLIEYQVEIDNGPTLRAQTHPRQAFAVGDSVRIAIDPACLSAFPAPPSPHTIETNGRES